MIFFKSLIRELLDDGHVVDIATNDTISPVPECYAEWGCNIYHMDWSRSPIDAGNIRSVEQLKGVLIRGEYDIVHCHTPIAAACTRIACKSFRKKGLRVIYTAHGFHFYKGAPAKNWLLYYPIEKICSNWTDVLITINREDYALAGKKLKAERIEYIPGVGIDTEMFRNTVIYRAQKRKEIGVPEDAFLVLSVGELNENKNHQLIVRAIAEIGDRNIHYAIAGKGDQKEALLTLAGKLGVEERLHLLGYRNDVAELYKTADVYALPSIREGLNVSVMEALASGMQCVVSRIRGNVDMVQDGVNGYYIDPFDVNTAVECIKKIVCAGRKDSTAETADKYSTAQTADKYNASDINKEIMSIYAGY